jgi:hypothetical protein
MIQMVSAYLMTAAFVQEDAVAGSQAFWVTRPISGARLLGAKLVGLVLLLWLPPLAVALPWWLIFGFGLSDLPVAVLSTAWLAAIPILLALPLAVLTEDSSHFVRYMLLALVGVAALFLAFNGAQWGESASSPGVVETRWVFVLILVPVLALAVFAHQYLSRRTPRTIGLLGVGLAAVVFVAGWWPYDLSGAFSRHREPPMAPPGIQATLVRASVQPVDSAELVTRSFLRLEFALTGLPEETEVFVDRMTVETADGRRMDLLSPSGTAEKKSGASVRAAGNDANFIFDDWVVPFARRRLGLKQPTERSGSLLVETGSTADLAMWSKAAMPLRVRLHFRVLRAAMAEEILLRPGAGAVSGGNHLLRIEKVEVAKGMVWVRFLERGPVGRVNTQLDRYSAAFDRYCLVNRRRSDVMRILPEVRGPDDHEIFNGVALADHSAGIDLGDRPANWVDEASLVRFHFENLGMGERTFEVAQLESGGGEEEKR